MREKNNAVHKVPASEMEAAELAAIRAAGFEDASELLAAYSALLKRQEMSQAELLAGNFGKGEYALLPENIKRLYLENTGRNPGEIDMRWIELKNGKRILCDDAISAVGNFLDVYTPLETESRMLIPVDNIASIAFSV